MAEETETEEKREEKSKIKEAVSREYVVPLRRGFSKTPRYKRVPRAIKTLKKFIARHMKIRDRDLRKIKIDKYLNEELWFRGIKKPPHKIKVKVKREGDNVLVELFELSEKAKYKKEREIKLKETSQKKKEGKKKVVEEESAKKAEDKTEEKKEEIEKEKATVEAGLKEAEKKAKEVKHKTIKEKGLKHQFRKALKK